jgi:uncharacterized protein YuzE
MAEAIEGRAKTMILRYSDTADALYIYLKPGVEPVRGEEIDSATIVDLDDLGNVVGIEVLSPARDWPLQTVAERYGLELSDHLQLRMLWDRQQNKPLPYLRNKGRKTLAAAG